MLEVVHVYAESLDVFFVMNEAKIAIANTSKFKHAKS